MRIRQYVYFALRSDTLPASAITARLVVEPDSILVRGAERPTPPVPACHVWEIECRLPGLSVDEQAARVLNRLRPVAERVQALTATDTVSAVLQVVRYFHADDGEDETLDRMVTDNGLVLEKLPGQHQLLGWHLTTEDLVLLASMSATLDVDEYG
jgi:Domain of unknown function (DUF4279)